MLFHYSYQKNIYIIKYECHFYINAISMYFTMNEITRLNKKVLSPKIFSIVIYCKVYIFI